MSTMRQLGRWLPVVAIAVAAVSCSGEASRPGKSVLVILIDTLRQDRLGCYGYEADISPHIDGIADEAMLFTHAYSVSSWTKPAIPSLFTSLYPSQHRVFEGNTEVGGSMQTDLLSEEAWTIAEEFRSRGYRTGAFVHNAHLKGEFGFSQGFDIYDEAPLRARSQIDNLVRWIDESDRPFFAYLHILDVHWPYEPDPESRSAVGIDDHAVVAMDSLDAAMRGRHDLSETELGYLEKLYDGEIYGVDRAIGELRGRIEDMGRWEELILAITSDHGEAFLEHGLLGHGHDLSEELLRVPLIVKGAAPRVVHDPVSLIDVMPTVLGLATGDALGSSLAGRSLPGRTPRPFELAELRHGNRLERALWAGHWKLVHGGPASGGELPSADRFVEDVSLLEGHRIEVELGKSSSGWYAVDLEIELPRDDDDEFVGRLGELDYEARRGSVAGIPVELEHDTEIGGKRQDLTPGSWVKIEGHATAEVFLADKIEPREPDSHIEAEGLISSLRCTPSACSLVVAGLEIACKLEQLREAVAEGRELFRGTELMTTELFDLVADPKEVDDRFHTESQRAFDMTDDLRSLLSELRREALADADRSSLDEDTLRRLRTLGYL